MESDNSNQLKREAINLTKYAYNNSYCAKYLYRIIWFIIVGLNTLT